MTRLPADVQSFAPELHVDLNALVRNYAALAQRSNAEVAAVVKADAYGLGVDRVAPALAAAGCKRFFTAYFAEGQALRRLLPDAQIYLMVPTPDLPATLLEAERLIPVLGTTADLRRLAADTSVTRPLPVALHLETGMHRMGFDTDDLEQLLNDGLPDRLRLDLLMSHLATADEPDSAMTVRQQQQFAQLAAQFPASVCSLANSAATLTSAFTHHDLVRPGLALYGCDSAAGVLDADLEPVASLRLAVAQIRYLPAGVSVGYGATVTTVRPTRLAVLCGGYADGVIRLAGEALASGQRAPIAFGTARLRYFGRVSMDLVTVDVTDLAPDALALGDRFEVFGRVVRAEELARHCQTLPYEVLTGVGGRTRRVYCGPGCADS